MKIYAHSGPHLWLLLWRSYHRVLRLDRASIGRAGFSNLSDFAVLEVLLHRGPLPVNTIGAKVMLTSGSITTAVTRLEQRGLVRRERDPDDARVIRVHLTAAGRACIEKGFAEHKVELDRLFSCLDPDERATLAALLRKIEASGH